MSYTCVGPLRGPCGRSHLTVSAAVECLAEDYEAALRAGEDPDRDILPAGPVAIVTCAGGRWRYRVGGASGEARSRRDARERARAAGAQYYIASDGRCVPLDPPAAAR